MALPDVKAEEATAESPDGGGDTPTAEAPTPSPRSVADLYISHEINLLLTTLRETEKEKDLPKALSERLRIESTLRGRVSVLRTGMDSPIVFRALLLLHKIGRTSPSFGGRQRTKKRN